MSVHQKRFIRQQLMRGESFYVVLSCEKKAQDIGFIDSNVKLNNEIAAFAAEYQIPRIRVSVGRSAMSMDGPSILFDVKVT